MNALLDIILVFAERITRQIYWSCPGLRQWRRTRAKRKIPVLQQCDRKDLLEYLHHIGVREGVLVMVHTGFGGLQIIADDHLTPLNAFALLNDLISLVGSTGTLVMPTNAKYQSDELHITDGQCPMPVSYDPERTPCGVGLVNELFWRTPGVKRSLFPYNMLAALGPLADDLLRDNLNDRKPSPHGMDSGYYRFCQRNGLIVSIGVPLKKYLTVVHVVEEVRKDWSIPDFYDEQTYRVVNGDEIKDWTIRLRRDAYAKYCYCPAKFGRDLVEAGIIHEGKVGSVYVDWTKAGEVYDFFWNKTKKRPYPYYGLWMIRKPWQRRNAT
jgi:aminoglycoside N3'-acetyltransferase